MKIIDARLFSYKIPLTCILPKQSTPFREGLIISLKSRGRTAWGEIAPLPFWSEENLQSAKTAVEAIFPTLKSINWERDNIRELLIHTLAGEFPSVSFGIESAILDLLYPLKEQNLITPISGYLSGTPEKILREADKLKNHNYKYVKLKVNQLTIKEAIDLSKKLRNNFELRIDSNKAWSLSQALEFCSSFTKDTFSYLEDPVDNFKDLLEFSKKTSYPIAVDEYFRTAPKDQLLQIPTLKAVIYKPMLQGALSLYEKYFSALKKNHIDIILSSTYESGQGILQIAKGYARLSHQHIPIGIDTYKLIKQDLLNTPHKLQNGHLYLEKSAHPLPRMLYS
ncbi:MAG: o-succinylbenzoate synthase [Simkaniaceae bacterium]|nr:o-succinylbenzoate synthase [Simkaniaceae bacterium]